MRGYITSISIDNPFHVMKNRRVFITEDAFVDTIWYLNHKEFVIHNSKLVDLDVKDINIPIIDESTYGYRIDYSASRNDNDPIKKMFVSKDEFYDTVSRLGSEGQYIWSVKDVNILIENLLKD